MQCPSCGGGLEYGAGGTQARCTQCQAQFMNQGGMLTPIGAPQGATPPAFGSPPFEQAPGAPPIAAGAGAPYGAAPGAAPGAPTPYGQPPGAPYGQPAGAPYGQPAAQPPEASGPNLPNIGVKMKIEGVPITFGTQGASIDAAKIGQKIGNKVSSMIWGWVIGGVILLLIVFGFVAVGGYVYYQYRSSASPASPSPGGAARSVKWDGKSPYECAAVDNVVIDGATANLPTATAIKASAGCNLTLNNVKITAATGIDASGNAKVTVKGGSINGSANSIVVSANAQVTVDGTAVTGKTKTSANGKVTGVK